MRTGETVDGRFVLGRLAGNGGMGVVYRALDKSTGEVVALKLLHDGANAGLVKRFAQEARVLGAIDHSHVVRYVQHGVAETGEPYLVMEWLEGKSLSERLSQGSLSIAESMDLTRRVASALAAAHARGIVHRDLKPSNIFLQNSDIKKVKLLDFGIARRKNTLQALTGTGTMLGTPGYMAPEQARGDDAALDARADVFSLGCVLFECVTGKPAFQGVHVMALLAKLLMEEAPRLRDKRPGAPAFLDELCASMLSKDPAKRPSDASVVLDALDIRDDYIVAPGPRAPIALTDAESRLISVIAMAPVSIDAEAPSSVDPTLLSSLPQDLLLKVRKVATPFDAKVEELANGTLVLLLVGAGPPTDQAARAARCALRLRDLLPLSPIVLLTGRFVSTDRSPVGEVFDSAASLLQKVGAESAWIHIDEITRALLDVRFDVMEHEGRLALCGEREIGGEARRLLGKPCPFVGRDRELRQLLDIVEEGIDESRASAVIVTGPAGIGKSRLRHEFVRTIQSTMPEVAVSIGRGESICAGSAFALLAGAFRITIGIAPGEPLEDRRKKLCEVVDHLIAPSERRRVSTFLGELIGIPFPEQDDPVLQAARQDATIMASRIEAAYVDFARAATDVRPVVVVLEDLQWGDAASLRLVDVALRELADRPFVVVAFARPEVETLFPGLFRDRGAAELRLSPLSRRSAEKLLRSVLGEACGAGIIADIVERARGNAFFLEELVRAVVEGQKGSMPETVLGMVEARLAGLSPDARRILRAASIFGEVFWERGLSALLGTGELSAGLVRARLSDLCEREFIVAQSESRLAGETQYAFRHGLVREGAYAMLPERDRTLGHEMAAEWLLQAGEADPMVLAAHFERGGAGKRAAEFYVHAAEHALRAGDWIAVILRAERGLLCDPEPRVASALNTVLGSVHFLNAEYPRSYACSRAAIDLLSPDDPGSAVPLGIAVAAAVLGGRRDALSELIPRLMKVEPSRSGVAATAHAFSLVAVTLVISGEGADARPFLRRLGELAAQNPGDLLTGAYTSWANTYAARDIDEDLWLSREHAREALSRFAAAGSRHYHAVAAVSFAWAEGLLGIAGEPSEVFGRVLATTEAGNLAAMTARLLESLLLLRAGRVEEAREIAERLMQTTKTAGAKNMHTAACLLLTECLLLSARLLEAERVLTQLDPAGSIPCLHARYLSLLAEARRHRGRLDEAARLAAEAVVVGRPGPRFTYGDDPLLLRLAEILHAATDFDDARRALAEARGEVLARADKIPDIAVRRSFLQDIPHNRRTLELSREWLGAG